MADKYASLSTPLLYRIWGKQGAKTLKTFEQNFIFGRFFTLNW